MNIINSNDYGSFKHFIYFVYFIYFIYFIAYFFSQLYLITINIM